MIEGRKPYSAKILKRFLQEYKLVDSKMKRNKKLVGVEGTESIYEPTDEVEVWIKFNIKQDVDGEPIEEDNDET